MKAARVTVGHLLVQVMIAMLWAGGARAADSVPIYVQPAQAPLGGYASQNAPNSFGSLYKTFDNFTLTTDALITDVEWQGSYSNAVHSPITKFEIIFWSDNAGLPGQALQTYNILGSAGEHFVASDANGFFAYSYTTHLPTPFAADAHTTYWLSIQPTVDFPPQWFWRQGNGGDGRSAQILRSLSPAPRPTQGDLAFALRGVPPVTQVFIDIKPGSFPNSINPRNRGKIPVAILTTATFDATTVDPTTVRFGRTGTEAAPVHAALQDVDGDGDTDMVLHFNTQETGILCGDVSASLTGKTFSEQAIEDSDAINTVGCK
jgi:hypothetical protein